MKIWTDLPSSAESLLTAALMRRALYCPQLRFPRKEGMRIDFILASPALSAKIVEAAVDREERKGKRARITHP